MTGVAADLLRLSTLALVLLLAGQAATWLVARKVGRVNVVDVTWGLGLAAVALLGLALGPGDLTRRLLLAVLVTAWGVRLARHVHRRTRGKGEDPRYAELLAGRGPGAVARSVFLTQGLAQWFVSLPLQVSAVAPATTDWWTVFLGLGVLLVVGGTAFEALGDAQLAAFKADPANRGRIMDRGLWAWTRHPNYFGDACVWWGVYLAAASAWPGALTILSPLAMTWFLVVGTGARRLERTMADRPGFTAYRERTSFFLPLPPRKPRT